VSEKISIYDSAAVDRLRAELKFEPRRLHALRTAFFKRFCSPAAALAELPDGVREEFARRVEFHPLTVERAFDSEVDGATKLVLRTAAGLLIEAVIMRTGTGRVSLCVSSQVGCAAACGFCATGQMGIARNLPPAEILDQVVLAGERLVAEGRVVRNIVFMGMGEPFHNETAVYEVVSALLAPELFHYPPRRILLSTVGIPDAMIRAARRFPQVNFALSLHSVRQSVREQPLLDEQQGEAVVNIGNIRFQKRCLAEGSRRHFQPPFPLCLEGAGDEALETRAVLSSGARHKKRCEGENQHQETAEVDWSHRHKSRLSGVGLAAHLLTIPFHGFGALFGLP